MNTDELKLFKFFLENNGKLTTTFGDYSKIYSMTTENIYGFLKNYNLNEKSVLTVNCSGDQLLNCILQGAKSVTCFDTNPFSFNHTKLKIGACQSINFEKFINFFGIYSRKYGSYFNFLDSKIFNEFKGNLDEDTHMVFDYIINSCTNAYNNLFFKFDNELSKLEKFDGYLNPNSYDRLSNISDYINFIYPENHLENYHNLIIDLADNLNQFGIMQVGYIYSYYGDKELYSDFSISDKRKQVFTTDKFHTMLVDSYMDLNKKDKIITYQKIRG